ncbi:hypothetical protein H2198_008053 [Neophaeococcomyces mojaviensis]|uniref:Uncharacterized protein n=1 Tax=Neophaeococcomyces mojaviensis TaxID=3383035 RepID=A0ACC2ZYD7_9EURO|nr:hypothetical protein H2198_008053 [Knufia sp. JES_112]
MACLDSTSEILSVLAGHALFSTTEQIVNGIDPVKLCLNKDAFGAARLQSEHYKKARTQLECFLSECLQRKSPPGKGLTKKHGSYDNTEVCISFPASHLAYWNLDKEAAFEISIENGSLDLPVNTMGQTLVHIAAQAGDIGFLKRLRDFDESVFAMASTIGWGYTAIDLATILDDKDTFRLLVGHGVESFPWIEHLVHLAFAANSPSIVSCILHDGRIVSPPYTAMVEEAIERDLEDVALAFLPYLKDPWTTACEIGILIEQARQKQKERIVSGLRALSTPSRAPDPITAVNAAASLRRHLAFLTDTHRSDA